jgi:hypothetical protein
LSPATDTIDTPSPSPSEPNGHWRSGAGRKGANRVHQLIQAGKLYESEHGLKAGRQRLKQLIHLGKKYELEHGLAPAPKKRKNRAKRGEGDKALSTLLRALTVLVKPRYKADLARLADALICTTQPKENHVQPRNPEGARAAETPQGAV